RLPPQPRRQSAETELRRRLGPRAAAGEGADRGGGAPSRDRRGAARRDRQTARRAVEGDRARLLRRLQPLGDRPDPQPADGDREGTDAARVGEDSRRASGGIGMSGSEHSRWSEDLAAYMLGALDAEEAAGFERHLE